MALVNVIEHGTNGFSVEVGHIDEMAKLIKMLASDRRQLKEMGRKANETIRNRPSIDEYTAWINKIVEEVWHYSARYWPSERPIFPLTGLTNDNYYKQLQFIMDHPEGLSNTMKSYMPMLQGFYLYEDSNVVNNLLKEKAYFEKSYYNVVEDRNNLKLAYHRILNKKPVRIYIAFKRILHSLLLLR